MSDPPRAAPGSYIVGPTDPAPATVALPAPPAPPVFASLAPPPGGTSATLVSLPPGTPVTVPGPPPRLATQIAASSVDVAVVAAIAWLMYAKAITPTEGLGAFGMVLAGRLRPVKLAGGAQSGVLTVATGWLGLERSNVPAATPVHGGAPQKGDGRA